MNQRFEDTYNRATDALCGMAKDFRLLDEMNRLLRARVQLMEDKADLLRDKLSAAQIQCEEFQHANGILAMDLVRMCGTCKHPEYREARFSLSSRPEEGEWDFDTRTIEHEKSDIDLAIGMDGKSFNVHPEAPKQFDKYFDVLMWRWVFNTVYPSGGRVVTVQ